MSTNKRTILELHLHSHGDFQMGPRSIGGEELTETTEGGGGFPIRSLALVTLGAIAFVLLRRRRRRVEEEAPPTERKNLDRWIPTR